VAMIGHLRHGVRRHPAVLIGCVLVLLFYLVGLFDVWRWAEVPLGDLLQSRRAKVPVAPDNIVVVGVDQSTLDTHGGGTWPLSRLAYATALQAIGPRGVTGVGLEMPLTQKDPALAVFDVAFARQVPKVPAVVMSVIGLQSGGETNRPPNLPALPRAGIRVDRLVDHTGFLLPADGLGVDARLALNNLPRGQDEPVRSIPLLLRSGGALLPSFFLQCLLAHEGVGIGDVALEKGGHVLIRRRGEVLHRIPVDGGLRMALPLRPMLPEPPRVGLDALVLAAEQESASVPGAAAPAFDLNKLRGRFVLICREATETYEPVLTAGGEMSPAGVFLQAWQTAFARDFIAAVPAWALWLACAPLAVFLVWFASRFHAAWAILMACFVVADLCAASYWMLSELRVWIFAVPPCLMGISAVGLGRWLRAAKPHHEGLVAAPPAKGVSRMKWPTPPGWSGPP
jgi:CHASE2 domain-containing sensor protein